MFNTLGNSIPRNGLVWEWLLDGNALDTSWNWNNWTATNVTWVKTDRGYQSQAGSFNGSSFINLPTTWIPIGASSRSFSIWVLWLTSQANDTVIYSFWSPNTNQSMWVSISLWWFYQFFVYWWVSIVSTIAKNTWPHFFEIIQNWTNISFYIDNNLIWSQNYPSINIVFWTHVIWRLLSVWFWFNWLLWIVRHYNRVLSQDEIQTLYLEGLRKLWPTNIAKYPALLSGLVGYWDFRCTAHNLVDGSLATVTGATLTTDRFWYANSAYSLNWTTWNIEQSYNSSLNITTWDFTVSEWFKSTSTWTDMSFWWKQVLWAFNWFCIDKGSWWSIIFYTFAWDWNSTTLTTANANAYFDWNRHNLIYQRRWSNLEVFLDWNLFWSTSWTIRDVWWTAPFTIWKINNSLYFNWSFWDCLFFNRALSVDEVKLLYNLTSQDYIYPTPSYDLASLRDGLVLDLNEKWYDLSWNGNNGTLVWAPAIVRQWRAKGLTYPTNAYISSINSSISVWNIFSVNFWAYIPASWTFERCVTKWNWWDNNTWRWWYTQIENTWRLQIVVNSTWSWFIQQTSSTNKIQYWKWNMCTFVYNSTTWTKFYIDWKLQTTETLAWSLQSVWVNSNSIEVNRLYNTWKYFYWSNWVKYLQERIRNRELSDKEIQTLHYSQKWNFIY